MKKDPLIHLKAFKSTYEVITAFQGEHDIRSVPHALKRIVEAYKANLYAPKPTDQGEPKPLDPETTH